MRVSVVASNSVRDGLVCMVIRRDKADGLRASAGNNGRIPEEDRSSLSDIPPLFLVLSPRLSASTLLPLAQTNIFPTESLTVIRALIFHRRDPAVFCVLATAAVWASSNTRVSTADNLVIWDVAFDNKRLTANACTITTAASSSASAEETPPCAVCRSEGLASVSTSVAARGVTFGGGNRWRS